MHFNKKIPLVLLFCFTFIVPPVFAADGEVKITSPQDSATLEGNKPFNVSYEMVLGPDGNHAHLYVDKKREALLYKLKDQYTIKIVSKGQHDICIKEVNKNHTPIGIQKCIKITIK